MMNRREYENFLAKFHKDQFDAQERIHQLAQEMYKVSVKGGILSRWEALQQKELKMYESPMYNLYLARHGSLWVSLVVFLKMIFTVLLTQLLKPLDKWGTAKQWKIYEEMTTWAMKERWKVVNDFNDKMIS